jgi:hypothetical protein
MRDSIRVCPVYADIIFGQMAQLIIEIRRVRYG